LTPLQIPPVVNCVSPGVLTRNAIDSALTQTKKLMTKKKTHFLINILPHQKSVFYHKHLKKNIKVFIISSKELQWTSLLKFAFQSKQGEL